MTPLRDGAIAIFLALVVVGCGDERPDIGPPPDLRAVSIRIDGPQQLTASAAVQFTAVQTWSDGSTYDVTANAQWTSTNPSVLSISAGRATGLAGGEVGLTASLANLTSQPKAVRVVPVRPEWDGLYTLTIGGGPCNDALPLAQEFRQRTYIATVRQTGLTLSVTVTNVGGFEGRIINPEARFTIFQARGLSRRVLKASIVPVRRAAYSGEEPGFVEIVNLHRLVIGGQAVTTMSSSGFSGTLDGSISVQLRGQLLGVCTSSSHGFTLVRR